MSKKRTVDAFRLSAAQVAFLDRGKGITSPNVQAAVEEIMEKLSEADHSHRGEGENSVQLGPDASAYADSSISLGHGAFTIPEAQRSVALGADSGAFGESSVAIGDGANSLTHNGVAIGAGASTTDEDARDAISIGTSAIASSGHATAIGANAQATLSHSLAIGVYSQSNEEYAIAIGTEAQANSANSVSVGREAQANADDSVTVGYGARANVPKTVVIGRYAESNAESGIAMGDSAMANSEASIAIGNNTMTYGGENIALGKGAEAYSERSVAIGSGSLAYGDNSVALGPGAFAEEANTIVLGTAEHVVIIPGNLDVLGRIIGGVTWFGPSDDVIAEIDNPIEVEWDEESSPPLFTEKQLTLKNPGRYRIKGTIYADEGSKATLSILDNTSGNPERIADLVTTTGQENFSVDFYWDINVNTTLTFRLDASPLPGGEIVESGVVRVTQVKVCGAKIDIENGVVGW